jgi:hypothetical protein
MSDRSLDGPNVTIGGVIPVTPGPWEDRWRELGYLPPVVGAQMPAHDGDIAQLEELADRVVDGAARNILAQLAGPPYSLTDVGALRTIWLLAYGPSLLPDITFDSWPADEAAPLLDAWKAQREAVAA